MPGRPRSVTRRDLLRACAAALLAGALAGAAAEPPRPSSPPAAPAPAAVRLRGTRVVEIRAALGGKGPEERARQASEALSRAVAAGGPLEPRLEEKGNAVTIFLDRFPVLPLGPADAAAGEESLREHAERVAASLSDAAHRERRRGAVQEQVFDVALVVLSGLLAFLLVRRLGGLEAQVEAWLARGRQKIASVRVGKGELLRGSAIRGSLAVMLRVGKVVAQLAVAYAWLLFALSLFPQTRQAAARLGRAVVQPVIDLLARWGEALPSLVVAGVTVLAVAIALRAIRLFFGSVARGETVLRWLRADHAPAASLVARALLVVLALVFAAPILGGSDAGSLGRIGQAALLALAVAAAPLVATLVLGVSAVFGQAWRAGDVAEVAGRHGKLRRVTLLALELEDDEGAQLRVPHLVTLVSPSRFLGATHRTSVDVAVHPEEDQARVRGLLLEAAGGDAAGASAVLRAIEASGAHWRVSAQHPDVGPRVASALRDAGVRLGSGPQDRSRP